MNTQAQIKRIEWMNQDSELVVVVREQKNLLSYDSKWIFPASSLNLLINEVQKQMEEDVNDCLKIEQWSSEEINYIFDFSSPLAQPLYLQRRLTNVEAREIRA